MGILNYPDMEYYDGELENEKGVLRILSDFERFTHCGKQKKFR